MTNFQYVAWFRDTTTDPDDHEYQDHEWCACFFVEAESEKLAQEWGDHLSRDYCNRMNGDYEFLLSYFDPDPWKPGDGPRVEYGEEALKRIFG